LHTKLTAVEEISTVLSISPATKFNITQIQITDIYSSNLQPTAKNLLKQIRLIIRGARNGRQCSTALLGSGKRYIIWLQKAPQRQGQCQGRATSMPRRPRPGRFKAKAT